MKKWIWISIISLVFIIGGWQCYLYLENIFEPQQSLANKTKETMLQNYSITEIHEMKRYSGLSKAYQVAKAETKTAELVYIWASETDEETYKVALENGWSKEKVLELIKSEENPKEIIRVTPGLEGSPKNRQPVWEVVFIDQNDRYTFYYLDLSMVVIYNLID